MSENFKRKLLYFYGCFGFLGLTGFRYFSSHDITDLYGFSFFAFFAYFLIGWIYTDNRDERYNENCRCAKAFTLNLAIIEICVLCSACILIPVLKSYLLLILFYCCASLVFTYSIKFYILEKR